MSELVVEDYIVASNHGLNSTSQWDYFWDETNVSIDPNDFETQALIVPVNLKGAMNFDTDRVMVFNIVWYDGNQVQHNADFGDAMLHSNIYIYAMEASDKYKITAVAYDDLGSTSDTVYYYIPKDIETIFIQSKVTSEGDGVIGIETFVSATPTFAVANAASDGNDFGSTEITQVGLGLFTSSLNAYEACVAIAYPYLTQHIDGAQMSDVSDPFPANSRGTGGWTLEADGTACDWIQLGSDATDLSAIDWTFNATNKGITTIDNHVTTIDVKVGEIDDDDAEEDWDDLNFFQKLKRIRKKILGVISTLTNEGVRGIIGDMVDNIHLDKPGSTTQMFNIMEFISEKALSFVNSDIRPWIENLFTYLLTELNE